MEIKDHFDNKLIIETKENYSIMIISVKYISLNGPFGLLRHIYPNAY